MFNAPVKEIDELQEKAQSWENMDATKASEVLQQFNMLDCIRIKVTFRLLQSIDAGLKLYGQDIFKYDMNFNQINGLFYSPEERTSMEISADIILDKTSAEVFVDGGAFSYAIERKADPGNKEGFKFFGNNIEVKSLKVWSMKSIWSGNQSK